METREARIKIVLDTAAAQSAVPASAPNSPGQAPDVPGLPDARASTSGAALGAQAAATGGAGTAGGFAPPSSTSPVAAAPGSPPPPYQRGTRVDLQPTAESESGNSASRPGTTAWAANAARGIRNVGSAAIGGGSLTSELAALPGIVPGIGTMVSGSAQAALKASNLAERYGPFIAGVLRGAARESGSAAASAMADDMVSALEGGLETVSGFTSNIDAIGSGVDAVVSLATGQGALARGRTLTAEQRAAQSRSLGIAFEAQRRISAREAQRQRASRRIGLIYAGDQLASIAASDAAAPFVAMLKESLKTAVHR